MYTYCLLPLNFYTEFIWRITENKEQMRSKKQKNDFRTNLQLMIMKGRVKSPVI